MSLHNDINGDSARFLRGATRFESLPAASSHKEAHRELPPNPFLSHLPSPMDAEPGHLRADLACGAHALEAKYSAISHGTG